MKTEQKQLGQSHGTTAYGLSPIAQAINKVLKAPARQYVNHYGEHADLLGAEGSVTPFIVNGVEYGRM